eukprot:CCRYP_011200-RA/>CCRYP_011200-RA protein AED:0.45 eAED:0.63 QI:0/0/0/1/0/0/2/0/128
MLAKHTPIISSTHFKATMKSPQIGRGDATLGLLCIGTTATVSAPRTYGSKPQLCANADTASALGKHQKTFVQEVIGVFLYYARAVDCTMLTALSSHATQQANPTTTTLDRVYQFLDYALSHPNAGVTY